MSATDDGPGRDVLESDDCPEPPEQDWPDETVAEGDGTCGPSQLIREKKDADRWVRSDTAIPLPDLR